MSHDGHLSTPSAAFNADSENLQALEISRRLATRWEPSDCSVYATMATTLGQQQRGEWQPPPPEHSSHLDCKIDDGRRHACRSFLCGPILISGLIDFLLLIRNVAHSLKREMNVGHEARQK